uniref:Serine protease gd N-terminal domain-containing protein n=2 Tax=Timema TaxID=61471 RepID=A0A7R9HBW0_TIMPO|nr:unnamed protein product [Timema douglasi]CAD7415690.1 unnamed protein product [Timema poppensis]
MLPALVCYVLLLLPATPPAQRLSSAVAGYTQNESRKPKRGLHPMSPCPSVFSYEGRQPEDNRWFGVILVTTDEPLTGFWLDVTLDHPAHILGVITLLD